MYNNAEDVPGNISLPIRPRIPANQPNHNRTLVMACPMSNRFIPHYRRLDSYHLSTSNTKLPVHCHHITATAAAAAGFASASASVQFLRGASL